MTFYGPDGAAHKMGSQGFSTDGEGGTLLVPLPSYLQDRVWLEPTYSRVTPVDAIAIPIK